MTPQATPAMRHLSIEGSTMVETSILNNLTFIHPILENNSHRFFER